MIVILVFVFMFMRHVLLIESGVKIAVRFVYLESICIIELEDIAVVWVLFDG